MYIETVPNRNSPPAILLREGWREGKKTLKRTLANLSHWPTQKIEALRRLLRDETLVSPQELFTTRRTLPHGHVQAVLGIIRKLGLAAIISAKHCRGTRSGSGDDCPTLAGSLLETGHLPSLAYHHPGGGVGGGGGQRGRSLPGHGLAAKKEGAHREEAGGAPFGQRLPGAVRRHQQLLRRTHLPAGPVRSRPGWTKRSTHHHLWSDDGCGGASDLRAGLSRQHRGPEDGGGPGGEAAAEIRVVAGGDGRRSGDADPAAD